MRPHWATGSTQRLSKVLTVAAVAVDQLFFPLRVNRHIGESSFGHLLFLAVDSRDIKGWFHPDLKVDGD